MGTDVKRHGGAQQPPRRPAPSTAPPGARNRGFESSDPERQREAGRQEDERQRQGGQAQQAPAPKPRRAPRRPRGGPPDQGSRG